jgi:hypothetical protein
MPTPLKPRKPCRNCSALVSRPVRVYCSIRCQHEYRQRTFIERWKRGDIEGGRIGGISTTIRRYLIDTHGEQCSCCGWKKRNVRTHKVPLEVDHVDGNYRNNRPSNLRLICPNCHSLTPTFRGLNRGHGREGRITPP